MLLLIIVCDPTEQNPKYPFFYITFLAAQSYAFPIIAYSCTWTGCTSCCGGGDLDTYECRSGPGSGLGFGRRYCHWTPPLCLWHLSQAQSALLPALSSPCSVHTLTYSIPPYPSMHSLTISSRCLVSIVAWTHPLRQWPGHTCCAWDSHVAILCCQSLCSSSVNIPYD